MADALRRFVPRAPRYTLQTGDNHNLRFAINGQNHKSFSTRFLNVSETGLAFLIDRDSAPHLGEMIKLEFPVPGGEQIAWFAKVVRLEDFGASQWWSENEPADSSSDVVVGVQFHLMPEAHRANIRSHLQERFREVLQHRQQKIWSHFMNFMNDYGWQGLMYILATLLTFGLLYFLTLPDSRYDSKRGSPWGHRFNQ